MKSELKALLFAAFCGTGLIATAGTEGTVTADLLNVRLKPELKSVVVAKLPHGTKVDILGTVGDFYEISAPDRTPVYVSAVYLRDGKVLSPVKMRTAMDRHAAAYGLLPAGTKVKVLLETPLGWAKIEPPASLKVYTAKNYVKAAEPVKESEAAKPAEAEKPAAPEAAKAVAVDVRPLEKAPEAPAEVKTAPAGEKKGLICCVCRDGAGWIGRAAGGVRERQAGQGRPEGGRFSVPVVCSACSRGKPEGSGSRFSLPCRL